MLLTLVLDLASYVVIAANAGTSVAAAGEPDSCEAWLGVRMEKLLGRSILPWIEESSREDFCNALRAVNRAGSLRTFETRWRSADGKMRSVQIGANPGTTDFLRITLEAPRSTAWVKAS